MIRRSESHQSVVRTNVNANGKDVMTQQNDHRFKVPQTNSLNGFNLEKSNDQVKFIYAHSMPM